jgi:hypothetical protein
MMDGLPNPTTHATLTGRCLKSADTWPSPGGGRARSACINPVCLRLGIFRLTLGQKSEADKPSFKMGSLTWSRCERPVHQNKRHTSISLSSSAPVART